MAAKDTPENWKIGEMFGKLPVLMAKLSLLCGLYECIYTANIY